MFFDMKKTSKPLFTVLLKTTYGITGLLPSAQYTFNVLCYFHPQAISSFDRTSNLPLRQLLRLPS